MKTKIKKIPSWKLLNAFTFVGINYHAFGTLQKRTDKGVFSTHDFYKTDKLTKEQKERLLYMFPSLEFFVSKSSYSPEIERGMIASPKAYRLKELNSQ